MPTGTRALTFWPHLRLRARGRSPLARAQPHVRAQKLSLTDDLVSQDSCLRATLQLLRHRGQAPRPAPVSWGHQIRGVGSCVRKMAPLFQRGGAAQVQALEAVKGNSRWRLISQAHLPGAVSECTRLLRPRQSHGAACVTARLCTRMGVLSQTVPMVAALRRPVSNHDAP